MINFQECSPKWFHKTCCQKSFCAIFIFSVFKNRKKIPGQLSRIPQLWLFGIDTSQNKEPLECPSKCVLLYKHEKKYFHILISATLENMSPERSCKIHWYSDESLADCRKTNTKFQRNFLPYTGSIAWHPGIWTRLSWDPSISLQKMVHNHQQECCNFQAINLKNLESKW